MKIGSGSQTFYLADTQQKGPLGGRLKQNGSWASHMQSADRQGKKTTTSGFNGNKIKDKKGLLDLGCLPRLEGASKRRKKPHCKSGVPARFWAAQH